MNGSLIRMVAIAEDAAMNDAILMRSFIEHLFFNVHKTCNSLQGMDEILRIEKVSKNE
jgi:hypothetical protein